MEFSSSGNEIIKIYSTNESLVVEKKITKICSNSSKNIGNLKKLSFEKESELVTLENSAFRYGFYTSISLVNCKKLQSLPIWCFRDCKSLSSLSLPEDGCLRLIDQGAFSYINITSIKIPSTVEEVADCAMDYGAVFDSCLMLVSVAFLENSRCKKLGVGAFWNCKSLIEFVVPPLVSTLSSQVFYNCKSLIKVVVLAKAIKINYKPFYGIESSIQRVYVCSLNTKNELAKTGIIRNKIVLLSSYSPRCKSRSFIMSFIFVEIMMISK